MIAFFVALFGLSAGFYAPTKRERTYEYGADDYSGADFGQGEISGQTPGQYRVLLPDGRVQVVTYDYPSYGGFVADVSYEGIPSDGMSPRARSYEPVGFRSTGEAPRYRNLNAPRARSTFSQQLSPATLGQAAPQYDYNFAVKDDYSGADFDQSENRDGYQTAGQYHVNLPDGRVQTITYQKDKNGGYVPEVKYEGEARKSAVMSGRSIPEGHRGRNAHLKKLLDDLKRRMEAAEQR